MRWVVWINGQPLLLGPGESPTAENVNKRLKVKRFDPLTTHDTIDAITNIGPNLMSGFEWVRKYYPEEYIVLDELTDT